MVGVLYFWTAVPEERSWRFGGEQRDYYNLLIDGFLSGQLHLKTEVSTELQQTENPYNPNTRPPGSGLHDATYYKGRYYLYFGAAPVVTLMLPFRIVTGVDLPLSVATVVFVYLGYLVSAALLLSVRRRYFPTVGTAITVMCLIALATASMGLVVVRRGNIWELPLSSGYCFAMMALFAMHRSLAGRRRAGLWFALAGFCLGLAVASRLSYLYASCVLLAPIVWWWWCERQPGATAGVDWRRMLAAGVAPLAVMGVAMAWYNYARFDHPLEFGVAYQLSGVNEAETRHFRFSYFPFNVSVYFWRAAEWSRYFPFIEQPKLPPLPPGFVGVENLYGVLPGAPVLWLALLAPLALWRRLAGERGEIGSLLAALGLLALATTLTLMFFYAAMARYLIDFVPAILLLACIGVLAAQRFAAKQWPPWLRRNLTAGMISLLVFSSFFGLMFGFALYGNFQRQNPRAYAVVARVFNSPAYVLETLLGTPYGPREYKVKFGTEPPGTREPLLATGAASRGDHVFVHHEADGLIRLGFSHDGGASMLSRSVRPSRAAPQRLRIEMGSLYPPEEHPFFAGRERAELVRMSRRLRVELDGDILLDGYQRFHPASPRAVFVGVGPGPGNTQRFSGELHPLARDRRTETAVREEVEAYAMRVRFAAAISGEPRTLLTARQGGGQARWSYRSADGFVRLQYFDENDTVSESDPVAIAPKRGHLLEWVQLRPSAARSREDGAVRLMVKMDGVPIWTLRPSAPIELVAAEAGGNSTSSGTPTPSLAGEFIGIDQLRDYLPPEQADYTAIRMRVQFPAEPSGPREPLIVTGRAGAADFLWVEYLDSGYVRFGLDHWGRPPFISPPVPLDRSAEQVLEIALGSFPGARWNSVGVQRFSVRVNGQLVWEQPGRLHRAGAEDVFVGYNPVGGTSGMPFFTGSILEVERVRPIE